MQHLNPLSQSPLEMDGVLLHCQMGHIYLNLSPLYKLSSLPLSNRYRNSKWLNCFPRFPCNVFPLSTISILLNTVSISSSAFTILYVRAPSWSRFEMDGILLPCLMERISLRQALVPWSSSPLTFYTFWCWLFWRRLLPQNPNHIIPQFMPIYLKFDTVR